MNYTCLRKHVHQNILQLQCSYKKFIEKTTNKIYNYFYYTMFLVA